MSEGITPTIKIPRVNKMVVGTTLSLVMWIVSVITTGTHLHTQAHICYISDTTSTFVAQNLCAICTNSQNYYNF